MSRRRAPLLTGIALVVVLVVGLPIAALAAYVVGGASAGNAVAATFPAPGKPTIANTTSGVSVSWTATALSSGKAVDGYTVKRSVGATTTTVCTTTSLSCADSRPTATATYVVVAKFGGWTSSSAAGTYTPDTTPPTITNLKLSADTGSSSTDFVTDVSAQTLSGTTEAGAQVAVAYNGSTQTTTASASGAFSVDLVLIAGAHDAKVTATDTAGNAASVTQSITLTVSSSPSSEAVVSGNTDTSMQSIGWDIGSSSTDMFCVTTTITGTSTTPKAWQLLVHLDKPPFYGAAAGDLYYRGSSQVSISGVSGDSTLAKISGVGSGNPWNAAYSNSLLDSSKTLTITLCDSSPKTPPVGDSSWYTATTSQGTRSANQACVVLTLTAKTDVSTNPFFFGWQGTVDLTAAKTYLTSHGKTINYVSWSPDPSGGYQFSTSPAASNPVADSYSLTSGRALAIKAGGSTTVTACVNAF
jgi:Bacterial Ig-like domain